jgi:hypothetical protein
VAANLFAAPPRAALAQGKEFAWEMAYAIRSGDADPRVA